MITNGLTISALAAKNWDGNKNYSYQLLGRIINQYGVKQCASGGYDPAEMQQAITQYEKDKKAKSKGNASSGLASLKEIKLEEEIKKLRNQQQLAQIEIEKSKMQVEELKKTQVESSEVTKFLLHYMGHASSLLRRVLLVNLPIETEGLDIRQKRTKLEKHYNELTKALKASIDAWQSITNNKQVTIPPLVQDYINELNKALELHDTSDSQ